MGWEMISKPANQVQSIILSLERAVVQPGPNALHVFVVFRGLPVCNTLKPAFDPIHQANGWSYYSSSTRPSKAAVFRQ